MGDNSTTTKPALEIALALSGGAARGSFHLGFIQALQENDVRIKAISGTSAGAIVGGAIACGVKPRDVLEVIKSKPFRRIFRFNWFRSSLYRIDTQAPILQTIFPLEKLQETPIKFFVCVSDLNSNEVVYFQRGDGRKLITASCALVPLFAPIEFYDSLLADGGIKDMLPTTPLLECGYPILGINLVPNILPQKRTIFSLSRHIIHILLSCKVAEHIKHTRWYVSPDALEEIRMFSFKDLDKGFELGYLHGKAWCDENL